MHKYALVAALCALACVGNKKCDKIITDSYDGFAIAFYHRPVSGSTYEISVYPICERDKSAIRNLNDNFKGVILGQGISFNLSSRSSNFLEIEREAKKLPLINNADLEPSLRSIYYCPVYLKIDSIERDLQSSYWNEGEASKEILDFGNQTAFELEYHFCVDFNIEALKPIRQ